MLQYLFSPTKQFTYESGKLLDAGKIYVYIKDTTNLATLYDDNGDFVSNPIILDANGRASVKADDTFEYRLEIYTNRDVLLYTCNAFYNGGDGTGSFVVRHDDTLTGNGTSLSPLGVSPLTNLAVDDTMTAYSATIDDKEALVLGVNGDWFNTTFSGAWSAKVDTSAFEDCCSSVNAELDNKVSYDYLSNNYYDNTAINILLSEKASTSIVDNYYTKWQTSSNAELADAFAGIGLSGLSSKKDKQQELHISDNGNVITAIHQNENGELSADFVPLESGGEVVPWISGHKTIYPTSIQLGLGAVVQSLSSFDLSGYKNHYIDMKGGVYRLPDEYMIASSLYNMDVFVPVSSFGNTTGFLSASIDFVSGNVGYVSSTVNTKMDKSFSSNFYPMTGNPSGFITGTDLSNYYTKNETSSKEQISAAIAAIPVGDAQVNNAVHTYSGQWFNVSSKLDKSAFDAYTGTDNTYYMQGGNGIGVSSNDVLKETTIYFTGATADNNVNTAVRTYSSQWFAVSGKLDKSFSSTVYAKTDTSSKQQISAAIANIPSGITLPITGWNSPSGYSANITPSSFKLNWTASTTGGNYYTAVYLNVTGITRDYYPGGSQSVGWNDLIKAVTSGPSVSAACFRSTATRTMDLYWDKISGLSSIKLITPLYDNPDWGGGYYYSAFFYGPYSNDEAVGHVEIKPNCDVTVVRAISGFGSNTAKYWAREDVKYDSVHDVFNTVKDLLFPIE